MDEVREFFEDYREKWLEAERELAVSWREYPRIPVDYEPVDEGDRNVEPLDVPICR